MTITRKAEYRSLRGVSLSGDVLDLGGSRGSEYHRLFSGTFSVETANISAGADITCDFEEPLPIKSGRYDVVLLINVLEHIFEYRQLLGEAARILRPRGRVVIVVPFLFPYHPSPNDFHRYTATGLSRALTLAGFEDVECAALGSGVCAARWALIERLLPRSAQAISHVAVPLVTASDWLLARCARLLGKKYQPSDYALGYTVTARCPV
jgi:SAM-dependent methyltransferase